MAKNIDKKDTVLEDYIIQDLDNTAVIYNALIEIARQRGTASVEDYFDLIGVDTNYQHAKYGWKLLDLLNTKITVTRGGYIIKFPELEVL